MRWYSVQCRHCGKRLLVPGRVAVRIADDVSFVLCDPCGDEFESITGRDPVERLQQPV
jgi:DNA-directed RNA polymerase subunit RPC12/RpoP